MGKKLRSSVGLDGGLEELPRGAGLVEDRREMRILVYLMPSPQGRYYLGEGHVVPARCHG